MPRPVLATELDIKQAISALCAESSLPPRGITPVAFRRAVSVRKVRERLGGGNPATIGRVINAVEQEVTAGAEPAIAIPQIPADIAELMTTLWRSAVEIKLDDIERLRGEARGLAERATTQVTEATLRADMLRIELSEVRAALLARDERIAQLTTDLAAAQVRVQTLTGEVDAERQREAESMAARKDLEARAAATVAAALERYEGLSQRLLEETAQQRQSNQAEVTRLASQLKFAEKRQGVLDARIEQLSAELLAAQGQTQLAAADNHALRYANTSLQAQLDELKQALIKTEKHRRPAGLPHARKRPTHLSPAPRGSRLK